MSRPYLKADFLFDLELYEHRELFEHVEFVWHALDKIASYLEKYPLGLHQGQISKEAYLINPDSIFIGVGSVIEPGAYVQGPCIIGNHCTIRHGAYVRGGVITGNHCIIGHATEIKNSILLNRAQAAHFAYVGDSIIGNNVNLGAGAKLANLLFSKKNIHLKLENELIETHRRKLGAILGDGVQLGCNSVTNPGTIVAKHTRICPCLNVGGVLLKDRTVRENIESVSYSQ